MNNILKGVLVLVATITVVQSLTCRQCIIGIFGTCFFPEETVCHNSTANCYFGEAQFNATGILTLHTRGCLDSDLCGRTITASLLGTGVTSSFKCCQTDLCNGASSVQLSMTAAFSAALVASVWGSWAF